MKKKFLLFALTGLLSFLVCPMSWAGVPERINFQGKLLDTSGNPKNGPFSMTFRICDSSGGDCSGAPGRIWTEDQSVSVSNGVFSVQLGSVTVLTPGVFSSDVRYVEIIVEGQTLSPRERLVASPYAFWASTAAGLADNALTADSQIASGAGISDAKLATIASAGKVSGAALTSLGSIPSGAGTVPNANLDSSSVTKQGNALNVANGLVQLSGSALVPNALLDISSVTKQGNIFNGSNQLVKLDASGTLNATAATGSAYSLVTSTGINVAGTGAKVRENGNDLVPKGLIAISTSACWPGWQELGSFQGRFIVGTLAGGTVATSTGTAFTSDLTYVNLKHTHTLPSVVVKSGTGISVADYTTGTNANTFAAGQASEVPYIQVKFCMKQ